MSRSIPLGTSAAVAAGFTHGMVYSAVNFNDLHEPISTYQGFFRHLLLAIERVWSYAHGWQPMSHIHDFGGFYAPAVHLICPLIGFAVFRLVSRHKVGIDTWKPMAIALLFTMLPGYAVPWVEAARTVFILLLMVWSLRKFLPDPVPRRAPA